MKFSVLVNNYNYARFLPEALESVSAQTHPAHEIIVVDDGSTDESMAVLTDYQKRLPALRVHRQANSGQLSAMRTAIQLASGDWCAFLDADDTWLPTHLAKASDALQKHPEVSMYYSGHRETDGPPLYRSKWPAGTAGPLAGLVSVTGVRVGTITSTILLRRASSTSTGGCERTTCCFMEPRSRARSFCTSPR
jgi:glycosyltransferase involved in cell wall biosynthesis